MLHVLSDPKLFPGGRFALTEANTDDAASSPRPHYTNLHCFRLLNYLEINFKTQKYKLFDKKMHLLDILLNTQRMIRVRSIMNNNLKKYQTLYQDLDINCLFLLFFSAVSKSHTIFLSILRTKKTNLGGYQRKDMVKSCP